jgi:hypothetical protein
MILYTIFDQCVLCLEMRMRMPNVLLWYDDDSDEHAQEIEYTDCQRMRKHALRLSEVIFKILYREIYVHFRISLYFEKCVKRSLSPKPRRTMRRDDAMAD